ncbi:hypothetical protein BGZ80_010969 [Entomortierella chlamydospora]|uniref:G domain-containing protein n=1 Tax=Entomortierella chlamydospora TaxID=101097 RepID=A0A9P6MTY1_9FUNG|nr:hypothetical protein BGZ80_010969 [Entomortierella chlamydospora]
MTADNTMKVILVMGITGAGKSYLIREISGCDVKVGNNLESCTQQIDVIQCQIASQGVVILDTPGFDDTHRSDTEVLQDVATFLEKLYKQDFRISGIIYLHNIAETRMRGSSTKNLRMFSKLCGEKSYHNVVMLTGRWGTIDQSLAEEREKQLKDNFWKMYLTAGCQIDRYRDRSDLVRIFEKILPQSQVVLDIQREMAVEGKSLGETAAGGEVSQEIAELTKKFKDELAELSAAYKHESDQMKAQMDKDRLEFLHKLEKLEADKIILMDEHRRREEAARAGMTEKFNEIERDRERQRIQYQQDIERAKDESDKLNALIQHHKQEMEAMKKQRSGGGCLIL